MKTPSTTLRAAVTADVERMATIWHRGWPEGHAGHVPAALYDHRRLGDFLRLVPALLDGTVVAADATGGVMGFVVVRADEVNQLYVDAPARGSGVAGMLLGHAEKVIAEQFDRAWLAVVEGNQRARRFYARQGWSNTGPIAYEAETAGGGSIGLSALRYEKPVR
jgi:GNAT superfamily N-acetyltransferase